MDPGDSWLPPESQAKLKEEFASRPVFAELPCGADIVPAQVEVFDGDNQFEFTLGDRGPANSGASPLTGGQPSS
jgi:hypothetical protein